MATEVKKAESFGQILGARLAGKSVVDGVASSNFATTIANIVYLGVGFGGGRLIKKVFCKNTKFGAMPLLSERVIAAAKANKTTKKDSISEGGN